MMQQERPAVTGVITRGYGFGFHQADLFTALVREKPPTIMTDAVTVIVRRRFEEKQHNRQRGVRPKKPFAD